MVREMEGLIEPEEASTDSEYEEKLRKQSVIEEVATDLYFGKNLNFFLYRYMFDIYTSLAILDITSVVKIEKIQSLKVSSKCQKQMRIIFKCVRKYWELCSLSKTPYEPSWIAKILKIFWAWIPFIISVFCQNVLF